MVIHCKYICISHPHSFSSKLNRYENKSCLKTVLHLRLIIYHLSHYSSQVCRITMPIHYPYRVFKKWQITKKYDNWVQLLNASMKCPTASIIVITFLKATSGAIIQMLKFLHSLHTINKLQSLSIKS